MSTQPRNRQPSGTPTGGEFTTGARTEPDVALTTGPVSQVGDTAQVVTLNRALLGDISSSMVLAASKFRPQGDGTMAILVDLPMYCPIQHKQSRPGILLGADGHAHLWLGLTLK